MTEPTMSQHALDREQVERVGTVTGASSAEPVKAGIGPRDEPADLGLNEGETCE